MQNHVWAKDSTEHLLHFVFLDACRDQTVYLVFHMNRFVSVWAALFLNMGDVEFDLGFG